ncbi:RWD domain protein [Ancylostoma duodenale]|uniref:RWD domain protein n=1 Tax=Ancylostoma duodenale TaxID=51022 RepID=A0A0C2FLC0_9BILA|nr:RWD domain protein [Ancylostoma duodenale]
MAHMDVCGSKSCSDKFGAEKSTFRSDLETMVPLLLTTIVCLYFFQTMDSNSCRQSQLDEKVVLEAIFGEDVVFTKNAWDIWSPLEVTIHLEPLHTGAEESRTFVYADLHVQCSETYPKSEPIVSIKNAKGLSDENIKELPMVLELCDEVRKFLYDRNRPPLGSFHDVMLRFKENQDFLLQQRRLDNEAKEVKALAEEKERQLLEAEWRKEVNENDAAQGDGEKNASCVRNKSY